MVKSYRLLSQLAFIAVFFALGVIALGAFTRLIDAGLGCPDWPGCYGHWLPNAQQTITSFVAYKAWAEMIHRYFAGTLSFLILMIVACIFMKKNNGKANRILAICLVLLVVYQILLGQWTVTLKLLPIIVTQHLLGGFLILSTLWLIYLHNRHPAIFPPVAQEKSRKGILFFSLLGTLLLLLQIALGAWTSTNYAALSCTAFPFCERTGVFTFHWQEAFSLVSPVGVNYEGGVLPIEARQTIQMVHRIGALCITLYFFILLGWALNKLQRLPALLAPLYVVLGLLSVQLCVGISNVIFKLPLVNAVSHTLLAALLLLAWMTFIFKLVTLRGVT